MPLRVLRAKAVNLELLYTTLLIHFGEIPRMMMTTWTIIPRWVAAREMRMKRGQ
jgi:hypothetical protein